MQVDKLVLLRIVVARIQEVCEECEETIWLADQTRQFRSRGSSGMLAHAPPLMFVALWVFLGALVLLPLGYALAAACYLIAAGIGIVRFWLRRQSQKANAD